jgi:hypothetical protein
MSVTETSEMQDGVHVTHRTTPGVTLTDEQKEVQKYSKAIGDMVLALGLTDDLTIRGQVVVISWVDHAACMRHVRDGGPSLYSFKVSTREAFERGLGRRPLAYSDDPVVNAASLYVAVCHGYDPLDPDKDRTVKLFFRMSLRPSSTQS